MRYGMYNEYYVTKEDYELLQRAKLEPGDQEKERLKRQQNALFKIQSAESEYKEIINLRRGLNAITTIAAILCITGVLLAAAVNGLWIFLSIVAFCCGALTVTAAFSVEVGGAERKLIKTRHEYQLEL